MCKNCYCDNYEKCSIVGYQPIGFCCSLCVKYDEQKPCVHEPKVEKPKSERKIELLKSEIKDNILIVFLKRNNKEFQLKIDLKAYFK